MASKRLLWVLLLLLLLPQGLAFADILLYQPIGGNTIPTGVDPYGCGPLSAFCIYANRVYPWLLGVAAGICVLWGVWGGSTMIFSAGDQAGFAAGKKHMLSALAGLLVLLFARTIMHTINPNVFP